MLLALYALMTALYLSRKPIRKKKKMFSESKKENSTKFARAVPILEFYHSIN